LAARLPHMLAALLLAPCVAAFLQEAHQEQECSTTCTYRNCSDFSINYGKFCGVGHTGCAGVKPCDAYDTCCQAHDACVTESEHGVADQSCHHTMIQCLERALDDGEASWLNAADAKASGCDTQTVVSTMLNGMRVASLFSHFTRFGMPPQDKDGSAGPAPSPPLQVVDYGVKDGAGSYVANSNEPYSAERDWEAFAERTRLEREREREADPTEPARVVQAGGDATPIYFQQKGKGAFTLGMHLGSEDGPRYDLEADAAAHAELLKEQRAKAATMQKATFSMHLGDLPKGPDERKYDPEADAQAAREKLTQVRQEQQRLRDERRTRSC